MTINRKFLALCRTLHIYLTMFALFWLMLFGVTGFTINHEEWFGATTLVTQEQSGTVPASVLAGDRLEVVERLRGDFGIAGAVTGYEEIDGVISVGFKSPRVVWEAQVDRATGAARVKSESGNTWAVLNNLHRGRYSGPVWSVIIDVTAILTVIACATGLVLWMVLPKRRKVGIAAVVSGVVVSALIYWLAIPGRGTLPPAPTPVPAPSGSATEPTQP